MSFLMQWIGVVLVALPTMCHWTARAPLPEPRAGYAAGVLAGRLIVAGGSSWIEGKKTQTAATDAFDPECNCWNKLPPLPTALSDAESVVVGGKLFVLGGAHGAEGLRQVYAFDGQSWKLRADMELPEPRLVGAAVTDGRRIFLVGGISRPGDYTSGLKTMWSIDPGHPAHGWTPLPEFPGAARVSFGAVFESVRILVIGGYEADRAVRGNLQDIWSFNIFSSQWSGAGTLPEGRRAMAAIVANHEVFLLGGFTQNFSADILALSENSAVRIGELPQPVADAKFFAIGPQWYTTGGEVGIHIRGPQTWSGEFVWPAEENRQ
jgi:N-acetylneuraminic acid mutarotase